MVNLVGKFAKVKSDKYEEYGLPEGTPVFVAGSGFSPLDDDDNYKLLFVVARLGGDNLPVAPGVTIARSSLEVLSDEDSAEYKKKMEDALPAETAAQEAG